MSLMHFVLLLFAAAPSWLTNPSYQSSPSVQDTHEEGNQPVVKRWSYGDSLSTSNDDKESHRHHRHKERTKHHKHHKEKKKTESFYSSKPATIWIDEAGLGLEEAYRIDHRSDTSNLGYDTLYSGDTANYRRWFGNTCIGSAQSGEVKFTDSRNHVFKKKKVLTDSRYYHGKLAQGNLDTVLHFTTKCEAEKAGSLGTDFLPLTKEKEGAVEESVETTPEVYITHRTSHYQQQLSESPHNIALWLDFIAFQDEAFVWGKPPGLFSGDELAGSSTVMKRHQLAVLERKIAIFERALESNPLSEDLLVGHMALVAEVWETERVVKRWKDIVFKQPHKSLLWLRYIEFCQSRFSFFRSSVLRTLYCKAISTLAAILDRSLVSHHPEDNAEKCLLALFLLYCYFLRMSGHTERGVACLQALVEFNICCPMELSDDSDISTKERVKFFEAYWDSGLHHVGEEGAVGWSAWWMERKEGHTPSPLGHYQCPKPKPIIRSEQKEEDEDEDEELQMFHDSTLSEAWVKLESHRDMIHCFPANDKEEEDAAGIDPDRVVLFDDVAQLLFIIHDTNLQHTLLNEMLRFLGAPILSPPLIFSIFPHLSSLVSSPCEVLHPFVSPAAVSHSLLVYHQPSSLGSENNTFKSTVHELLCSYSPTVYSSVSPSSSFSFSSVSNFISNLFNQLVSLSSDTSLAESWLLHEYNKLQDVMIEGNEKNILGQQLHSLALALLSDGRIKNVKFLWWFVAQLEQALGTKRKPCELSKQFLKPFTTTPLHEKIRLTLPAHCQFFIECVLGLRPGMACYHRHKGNHELALYALVLLAEDEFNPTLLPVSTPTISPARLLRAENALQKCALRSVKTTDSRLDFDPVPFIASHGYYQYLLNDLEISCAALREVEQVMEEHHCTEKQHTFYMHMLESTYILHTRLILHHSLHHPIKPHLLRDVLQHALQVFPNHCWLLQSYIESEQHSYISGDLRRFFSTEAPKSSNVNVWLFTVLSEVQRHHRLSQLVARGGGGGVDEPVSGLLHRIRAILTRACQARNGRLCPALWRLKMKFEVIKNE